MDINLEALGITKETLIKEACRNIADQLIDDERLFDRVRKDVDDRIDRIFSERLDAKIEATLNSCLDEALNAKVSPVNIWGEQVGEPTTIRDQLAKKSVDFWNTKVDSKGQPSGYGGKPRYQHLMEDMLDTKFTEVVSENVAEIVEAFKTSLKNDAFKKISENLDRMIKAPKNGRY